MDALGPGLVRPAPEYGTDALRILKTSEVIKSRAFEDGMLYLMQPWSMNVIRQLPVEDGWQVLDMCAAPGGKSIALADRADIHVIAADVSEERIIRLKENIERCQVFDRITTKILDGRSCATELGKDRFDAVLLDAPCSNLGVVQRNPEIRWRICPDDIMTLASLQRDLLAGAAGTVKPGGYILYSVCTITREETEQAVACALQKTPGLECIASNMNLPGQEGMDGGYWALLKMGDG
jgi:16S rRNA (cytosine967-C5)-methyltransferase